MDTPVTGANTPLPLAELRQSLLAVVVGNPLFSDAEQLNINHAAHEIEDAAEMAALLRGLRTTDAERGRAHRNQAARDLPQPGVCTDPAAHTAELERLLHCRQLDTWQKRSIWNLMLYTGLSVNDRLSWLGNGWLDALETLGRIPARRGFSALLDN